LRGIAKNAIKYKEKRAIVSADNYWASKQLLFKSLCES
jgi:hypothetical protein